MYSYTDATSESCTAHCILTAFQHNRSGCDKLCLVYQVVWTTSASLGSSTFFFFFFGFSLIPQTEYLFGAAVHEVQSCGVSSTYLPSTKRSLVDAL